MANHPRPSTGMREMMPAVEFIDSQIGRMGIICHRPGHRGGLPPSRDVRQHRGGRSSNVRPLIPLSIDPPDHKKYRKILDPLFAPRAMAGPGGAGRPSWPTSSWTSSRARRRSTSVRPFRSSAVQVFLTLLGLPLEELPKFLAMKDGIIRPQDVVRSRSSTPPSWPTRWPPPSRYTTTSEAVLDERTRSPSDDLCRRSWMTEIEGDRLTREEILDISFLFLIAGLDTVTRRSTA